MEQTIEIEVPDGKKAVWKDNKIVFEDIKLQLPNSWEEFCRKVDISCEYYIDSCSCINKCVPNFRHLYYDKKVLPSREAAEAHLALMQLHQLRDCYRQGWVPDYLGESGKKWYITKYYNRLVVNTTHIFSEFLSFQSKEIAQKFLDNFRDLIEQAGDLI